jgi:hypothetical protein
MISCFAFVNVLHIDPSRMRSIRMSVKRQRLIHLFERTQHFDRLVEVGHHDRMLLYHDLVHKTVASLSRTKSIQQISFKPKLDSDKKHVLLVWYRKPTTRAECQTEVECARHP